MDVDNESNGGFELSQNFKASTVINNFHINITADAGWPARFDLTNIAGVSLMSFQVRALPTVFAFRGGKPIDKFVGALNEAGVEQFLDKL
jgi:hypothetical protein